MGRVRGRGWLIGAALVAAIVVVSVSALVFETRRRDADGELGSAGLDRDDSKEHHDVVVDVHHDDDHHRRPAIDECGTGPTAAARPRRRPPR